MKWYYCLIACLIDMGAYPQVPVFKDSVPEHTFINVVTKENFTLDTDSILKDAIALMDSVINTDSFKKAVLSCEFVNARGCSNQEILTLLLKGHEVWKTEGNDTLEFNLMIYPDQNGDNIGTTYHSKVISTSKKYILKNRERCYAAHLIHEYCHTMGYEQNGFSHIHNTSGGRKREKCLSVPYQLGEIARQQLGIKTCFFECEGFK